MIDARPELTRFSAVQHEDLIRTFRNLDKEFAELTTNYIRAKLSGHVPTRESSGTDPGYGVLARELQKKIRHKPVRQLVSEMGRALTTLTPCLMMSPLSVAQFLPAEIQAFDLVVFDEASQITVPDAIGAIARGERCIVVGDPRQMPPTRFFERGAEEDENEEVRDLEHLRQYVVAPDDNKVFWPDGVVPEALVHYRGLTINGERREWREVPHPEKLWLVRNVLENGSDDPARAVAHAIGTTRITKQFQAEIAELVRYLWARLSTERQ